jgi:hypothetical protein
MGQTSCKTDYGNIYQLLQSTCCYNMLVATDRATKIDLDTLLLLYATGVTHFIIIGDRVISNMSSLD